MAQQWPPSKVKLAQDAFDEAVKTNIEDFDMEPDEAVRSAVEEFEMQGYDVSAVIKSATPVDLTTHPVATATSTVQQALEEGGEALQAAVQALQATAEQEARDSLPQLFAVAHKAGTVQALLASLDKLDGAGAAALLPTLRTLKVLMASVPLSDAFSLDRGPDRINGLLSTHADSLDVVAEVVEVAEAASTKEEENKVRFMEIGFAEALLCLLEKGDLPAPIVIHACGCLRSFTTADDDRPPACKAFAHARTLATKHSALKVLLGTLTKLGADQPEAVAAVMLAVRAVAANEEACKGFTDDGGVMACLQVLRSYVSNKDVVRAACSALRQLANSDVVKLCIAERDGIPVAMRLVTAHSGTEDVLEAALSVLVNITLRQPGTCALAAELGVTDLVVEVMQEHPTWGTVQRQCCLLVRNMVVRNPELRAPYLEKGIEPLLRAAKRAHKASCNDVGLAALRDLQLDNYND